VDDLHPDPSFPGCIYSEMKMCLAPCFKGCTDEEYYAEVNRVQAYFDSGEILWPANFRLSATPPRPIWHLRMPPRFTSAWKN